NAKHRQNQLLFAQSVNSNGKMNGHRDGKATSFIKVYGLRACTESRSVILWNNNKFLILNDLIFDMLLAALRHRFSLCSI
ncbi:MAG: hypothetical protein ACLVBJ_08915, partial [Pilosibacter sp.]